MESVTLSRAQKSLDIAKKVADNNKQLEDGKEYKINLSLIGAEKDTVQCISGTVTFKDGVGRVSNNLAKHLGMGATLKLQDGGVMLDGQNTQNFAVSSNFNGINIVGRERDEKEDLKDIEGNHLKKEDINLKNAKDTKNARYQLDDKKFKQQRQAMQDLRAESNSLINKEFQDQLRNMPRLFRMLQMLEDYNYNIANSQAAAKQFTSSKYGLSIDALQDLEHMHSSIHNLTEQALRFESDLCSDCNAQLNQQKKPDDSITFSTGGKASSISKAYAIEVIAESIAEIKKSYIGLSEDRIIETFFPGLPASFVEAIKSQIPNEKHDMIDMAIKHKEDRAATKNESKTASAPKSTIPHIAPVNKDYMPFKNEAGEINMVSKQEFQEKLDKQVQEDAYQSIVHKATRILDQNTPPTTFTARVNPESIHRVMNENFIRDAAHSKDIVEQSEILNTSKEEHNPDSQSASETKSEQPIQKSDEQKWDIQPETTAESSTNGEELSTRESDSSPTPVDSIPVGHIASGLMAMASLMKLNSNNGHGAEKLSEFINASKPIMHPYRPLTEKTPSPTIDNSQLSTTTQNNISLSDVEITSINKSDSIKTSTSRIVTPSETKTSEAESSHHTETSVAPTLPNHTLVDWSQVFAEKELHSEQHQHSHTHTPEIDPELSLLENQLRALTEQQEQELFDLDATFDERTLRLVLKHLKFSREDMRKELYEYSNQLQADKTLTPAKRKQKLLIEQEKIKKRQSKELIEKLLKQKFLQRQLYAQLLLKHSKNRVKIIKLLQQKADKLKNTAIQKHPTPVMDEKTQHLIEHITEDKMKYREHMMNYVQQLIKEGKFDKAQIVASNTAKTLAIMDAKIQDSLQDNPEAMAMFIQNSKILDEFAQTGLNNSDYKDELLTKTSENLMDFVTFRSQQPGSAVTLPQKQLEDYCDYIGVDKSELQVIPPSRAPLSVPHDNLLGDPRKRFKFDEQLQVNAISEQVKTKYFEQLKNKTDPNQTGPTGPQGPQ